MNFEEHISAFLDGALSPGEETEFLHILSVSPEKRELFHSYLGVQSALAADARGSAVPPDLDAAVFAAAGIAAGGAAAGGAAAGGAAAGGAAAGGAAAGGAAAGGAAAGGAAAGGAALTAASWWSATRVISAIILGLSLFGAGYFLNDRMAETEDTSVTDTRMQDTELQQDNGARESETRSSMGDDGSRQQGTSTTDDRSRALGGTGGGEERAPRIVYRNVYVTRVDTVYLTDASSDAAPQLVERVVDTVSIALMQNVHHQRPLQIIEAPRQRMDMQLPGRIEIELQREHLTTYPYIDYDRLGVDRNQQQFAASAGWIFDRHHTAGIMVGQKSFAMDYYQVDRDSIYLFQQQPALTYGGAFYRLSMPVLAGVTPEFTIMLGGADYGPILGGRLAVQLAPFDHVSIVVGANGTLLAYRYKDKLFTSHSLGLSYGIRYRF